jgi:hypothetical protein
VEVWVVNGMLVELGAVSASTVSVPVQDPAPPPGKGEEFGSASPVALIVVLVLALATGLLIRSMSRRIRRLPASFDEEPEGTETSTSTGRSAEDAGGNGS